MTSFALPELHLEVRQTAQRFAREVLVPAADAIDEGGPIAGAVVQQLAELGFWGLATDEVRGGVGLDALAYVLVVEALTAGSPSVARRLATHAGPAMAGLERTARDLGAFCEGEALASYVPFPGALAPAPADVYVTPRGVSSEAAHEAVDPMGHRGAGLARVTVRDPEGDLDAPLGAWDDLGSAAIALGSGRAAYAAAVAYAQEREQFGRPLAALQAIQWKIADSAMGLDIAELLLHRAASSLDPVHAATARGDGGPPRARGHRPRAADSRRLRLHPRVPGGAASPVGAHDRSGGRCPTPRRRFGALSRPGSNRGACSLVAEDLGADIDDAGADHVELLGRCPAQVEDTRVIAVRPPVVDPDDDGAHRRAVAIEPGDPHPGTEGQVPRSRGQRLGVVGLAARGRVAGEGIGVIAGPPFEHLHDLFVRPRHLARSAGRGPRGLGSRAVVAGGRHGRGAVRAAEQARGEREERSRSVHWGLPWPGTRSVAR